MGKYDTATMAEDRRLNEMFGDNGGLVPLRINRETYIKCVLNNGLEITTAAGEEYWRDQVKKFPHLATNEKYRHIRVPRGTSRFGQASLIYRAGCWWKYDKGEWIPARAGRVHPEYQLDAVLAQRLRQSLAQRRGLAW